MKLIQYILPALLLMSSCGDKNPDLQEELDANEASNTVLLTTSQFKTGDMQLGAFSEEAFHQIIQANGMLDVPPENKSTVCAYFGGYVKHISLLQGQKVEKGQTLFILESPEYIEIQQDFLESKSQLKYLKLDYERQQDLSSGNISSQKIFYKAESEYKVMSAKYESLKKKLQLMNINSNTISENNLTSTISVVAPISGYITSVIASKGMFLNPSDIALTITNVDHMHVELNIFEQDLKKIAVGQEISFRVQNDNISRKATVYLINKAVDMDKRTIKVHCHLVNENDVKSLNTGMYVEAKIYTSSDTAYALPVNSVITYQEKSYILKLEKSTKDNYTFKRTPVKLGQTNASFVEILNANSVGMDSEILTEGAFNLIKE